MRNENVYEGMRLGKLVGSMTGCVVVGVVIEAVDAISSGGGGAGLP